MSNLFQNIIVLTTCWIMTFGGGVYATYVYQPDEMKRLEKAKQVANMKQAELSALMAEMGDSESRASTVSSRWNSRYKIVPKTLGSEDVVAFLNEHTRTGFNPFDITFKSHEESEQFYKLVFAIDGRGDFNNLYELIWAIENSRQLYRIDNLKLTHFDLITGDPQTNQQRLEVLVSFSFEIHAFYGGVAGLSASDGLNDTDGNSQFSDNELYANLPAVPDHVLPARNAVMNPFHPLILENIPPNTYNRVDMEEAELLYIVGTDAVILWNDEEWVIGIGDPVYLGQVISVDPRNGTVIARLNKGGLIDQIELKMDLGDLYKQARGSVQLAPTRNN